MWEIIFPAMTFFMCKDDFIFDFNFRVESLLKRNRFSFGDALCLGVSGGADSICLLTSIADIFENAGKEKKCVYTINVVTIDHRIREKKESSGDCEYVKNYCKKLNSKNLKVNCEVISLKKDEVFLTSEKRKRGIEEAARYLRYEAFKNFCIELKKKNSVWTKIYFALAHNKNDQLETLIMRFIQGAGSMSRYGILETRKEDIDGFKLIYIRPLIEIERSEIEEYLKLKNVKWRTDSTNSDNEYLRNRIRNVIIPVFDQTYPGWKTALINGREKALYEKEHIDRVLKDYKWKKCSGGVCIDKDVFYSLDDCSKNALLYRAFETVKNGERVPFLFVKSVIKEAPALKLNKNGIEVFVKDSNLFVKKTEKKATESGFFAIIEDEGSFDFETGTLHVKELKERKGFAEIQFVTKEEKIYSLNGVSFPFCFRSRGVSDRVFTKGKGQKTLNDVLSDFKVSESDKSLIPIVEELGGDKKIRAVWGSVFGYKDWIVKD